MQTSNKYILLSESPIPGKIADEMLRHFTQPCTTDLFFPRKIYFDNHETVLEMSFFKDLGEIRYLIDTEERKFKDAAIWGSLGRNTSRKVFEIKIGNGIIYNIPVSFPERLEVLVMELRPDQADDNHDEENTCISEKYPGSLLTERYMLCSSVIGNAREIMILSSALSSDEVSSTVSIQKITEDILPAAVVQKTVKKIYERLI